MSPEQKIASLGLVLPPPLPPRANYIPYRRVGNLIFLSGHGPRLPDNTYRTGRVTSEQQIPDAYAAARLTALNILATLKESVGDLSKIVSIVKLIGMVNADATFTAHSKAIDGCSDLLVDVLGDAGRHARSAVGMSSLPNGMIVEVEAIAEV